MKKNRLTQIQIPNVGKIQYIYGEDGLSKIQRLDEQDNLLYTHRYHSNELEKLPFNWELSNIATLKVNIYKPHLME